MTATWTEGGRQRVIIFKEAQIMHWILLILVVVCGVGYGYYRLSKGASETIERAARSSSGALEESSEG
jgi:hypothetical protein